MHERRDSCNEDESFSVQTFSKVTIFSFSSDKRKKKLTGKTNFDGQKLL